MGGPESIFLPRQTYKKSVTSGPNPDIEQSFFAGDPTPLAHDSMIAEMTTDMNLTKYTKRLKFNFPVFKMGIWGLFI